MAKHRVIRTPEQLQNLTSQLRQDAKTLVVARKAFTNNLDYLQRVFFPDSSLQDICQHVGVTFDEVLTSTPAPPARASKRAPKKKTRSKKAQAKAKPRQEESQVEENLVDILQQPDPRPPLKEALIQVLGMKSMSIDEVLTNLRQRDWLPESTDVRSYVRTTLGKLEGVRRVSRGHYRLTRAKAVPPQPRQSQGQTVQALRYN